MKTASMKVEQIDVMGTDLSVANAARVSFHKESSFDDENNLRDSDAKLISYLAKHGHWSPFAHCFMSFRIKAPIFVARQLVKHQVGLTWNEVSRRYVSDEPEFWFPTEWRGKPVNAKQGSNGTVTIPDLYVKQCIGLNRSHHSVLTCYEFLLEQGVAPEQARMILPQNMMTEWIWSGSLMAFARVCKLRLDPHAQAETREIAAYIAGYCEVHFPVSFKALMEN